MAFISPQAVADAFVEQYHTILERSTADLHKFYRESSILSWPETDGSSATHVTTLSAINEKILSSDFKTFKIESKTVKAQSSVEGAVFVSVTGILVKDNVKRNYTHNFFLAKQERGFYVFNDVLHIFDVIESRQTIPVVNDVDRNEQVAPIVNHNNDNVSVSENISTNAATNTNAAVQNGHVEQNIGASVRNVTNANVVSPTPSATTSAKKVSPVLVPTPDIKEFEAPKITYASILAKEVPPTSPKAISTVPSNSNNQRVAPPKAKASPPSNPNNQKVAPSKARASSPSSNGAPKLPTASNNGNSNYGYVEGAGIYIGKLPYEITKQGVAEVVKRFGPVRRGPDSIQIRRHDDGFCCGFVEFESADAARRAVEVHHVKFGEEESYISFKRSSFSRGNDRRGRSPRGRSPSHGVSRRANSRGQENGEWRTR